MSALKIRDMALRNMWTRPSGELCVRPGLRRVYTAESGRIIDGAWSVRSPYTGQVWHYVVDHADSGAADVKVRIYDDAFTVWQVYDADVDVVPRAVTFAVAASSQQVLICSPDFATVYGVVGSGLVKAATVASANSSTTALSVPRGLVVSWASRMVIADGPSLYISDPITATQGDVRTYVGANQQLRPQSVYGLHVSAGGALIAVTTDGVYALPESAAAAGQVAIGDWRKLTDVRVSGFRSSCISQGRLYALTRRGYRVADVEGSTETVLDEPYTTRAYAARIAREDWREGSIWSGQEGPIACDESGAFHMRDLPRGIESWWTMTHSGETAQVRGFLYGRDGEEHIVTQDGAYRLFGGFDGEAALSSETATTVQGTATQAQAIPPSASLTVRNVVVGADNTDGNLLSAVDGTTDDGAPTSTQTAPVIGTDSWGGTWDWEVPALRSRSADFAIQTDDPVVEVGAENPGTRVAEMAEVEYRGIGTRREVDR